MEGKVEYHFSIHILFKQDVDVFKLSKKFKLEPYKLTLLKDCKGPNKCAKMWYRTKDLTDIYTGEKFEKFVLEMKDVFKDLPEFLKEFDGSCEFSLVFTEVHEKPCIHFTEKTIKTLDELNACVDFDFYV